MSRDGELVIRDVAVRRLVAPLPNPFWWATGVAAERRATLVRVSTRGGLVGWGETLDPAAGEIVERLLASLLVDGRTLARPQLRPRMVAACRAGKVPAASAASAVGSVEIALWDIAGQVAGRPLHSLLGGARRRSLTAYGSGLYYRSGQADRELASEAEGYVERGFRLLKMKVGKLSVSEDAARVSLVRAQLLSGASLAVDANQAYDLRRAAEMAKRLAAIGVRWFEEPLPIRNYAGYDRLAQCYGIPLAAGESFHGRRQFSRLLLRGTIEFAQPNVARIGGVAKTVTVAALAERCDARLAMHGWGVGVLQAAAAHIACCLDEEPLVEFDCTPNPLRAAVAGGPVLDGGTIRVSDAPGLGITVDEAVL